MDNVKTQEIIMKRVDRPFDEQIGADFRLDHYQARFLSAEARDPALVILRRLFPYGRTMERHGSRPHQHADHQLGCPQAGICYGVDHERVNPAFC